MMKITGLSHLFKWENLHNWWLTKYFFAPLYIQIYILGVSRYTGIDDNRNIQIIDYRYRVNLVCDDIPVLAITAIFKMNRTLSTPHVNTPAPVSD